MVIIYAVFLYCFTTFAKNTTLKLHLQLLSPEAPFSPRPRASRRDGGWPLRQRQRSFESTPGKINGTRTCSQQTSWEKPGHHRSIEKCLFFLGGLDLSNMSGLCVCDSLSVILQSCISVLESKISIQKKEHTVHACTCNIMMLDGASCCVLWNFIYSTTCKNILRCAPRISRRREQTYLSWLGKVQNTPRQR